MDIRKNWSNDYVGIPFELGGRSDSGLDCWGLVCHVYAREFDRDLPQHTATVQDETWWNQAEAAANDLIQLWEPVDLPEPGDVYIFRIMGHPVHVGIHVTNSHFLHVMRDRVSGHERMASHWVTAVIGCYRLK